MEAHRDDRDIGNCPFEAFGPEDVVKPGGLPVMLVQPPGPFHKSNSSDVRTNATDLHARLHYGSLAG
jgi:hypothetical protein